MEPCGTPRFLLRADKNIVPQPRFKMALHFGQVEVRAAAAREQFFGVVKEIESEIEDGTGHRFAIDEDVPLFKVPAARAHKQNGGLVVELVLLAGGGIGERDGAADGIAQIDVAVDQVVPRGRARVFEIGHEHLRAGVERVDDHLAIDGPGNFDAAVENIGGQAEPLSIRTRGSRASRSRKSGLFAGVEALLPFLARVEQLLAAGVEGAVQVDDEGEGFAG